MKALAKLVAYCAQSNRPALLLALAGFLLLAGTTKHPLPEFDSHEYLTIAFYLLDQGFYAFSEPGGLPAPTAIREPGYVLFLAGMMVIDPGFGGFTLNCLTSAEACATEIYAPLRWANSLFIGLSALLLFRLVDRAGLGRGAAHAVLVLTILNFAAASSRHYLVSDYLAMLLLCLLLSAYLAARQRRSVLLAGATGLILAALVLTKAVFFYFALLALAGAGLLALIGLMRGQRRVMAAFAVSVVLFGLPVTAWMQRNEAAIGHAVLAENRGGLALAIRDQFNSMTAKEYAMAFLWWTRSVGDNWARDLFEPEDYHRFRQHYDGSFYDQGIKDYRKLRRDLMKAEGISRGEADHRAQGIMMARVLEQPLTLAATTLPLFYRGLWVDEFFLLSVPGLVYLLLRWLRRRQWDLLVLLSPGLFSLAFYPLVSLNIPRYQVTALPSLSIAGGVTLSCLIAWWISRRQRKSTSTAD